MAVSLPMAKHQSRKIGEFNLKTGEINTFRFVGFSCQSTVHCCRELRIPVSDFDIERIEAEGYALDQIIEESVPMIRFFGSTSGAGEKTYWMKKKPFDNSCTFLENDRCSIHEFKPFACRIFPFSLEPLDEDIVQVNIHPDLLCPSISMNVSKESTESILEELLHAYEQELETRRDYFDKYAKDGEFTILEQSELHLDESS